MLISGATEEAVSYQAGVRRLRKRGWAEVTAIELRASTIGKSTITGWNVIAGCSREANYLFLCVRDNVARPDESYFTDLVRELWAGVQFDYGIVYRRPMTRGPHLYALGMAAGLGYSDVDRAEARSIAKWFHATCHFAAAGQCRASNLRDVYTLSFLSPDHLQQPAGGKSLRAWIDQSTRNGELAPLVDGRWAWRVADQHVADVRSALKEHSLLVAYRPDVPPIDDAYREWLRARDPERYASELKRADEVLNQWSRSDGDAGDPPTR